MNVGSVNADVVAVEAGKAAQRRGIQPSPVETTRRGQQVVSLTERRLTDLPGSDRPLPSATAYDDLLGKGQLMSRIDQHRQVGHSAWCHRTGRGGGD